MQPIYFEVENHLSLMIVPESDARRDGHPIRTYSYAIYRDPDNGSQPLINTDRNLN